MKKFVVLMLVLGIAVAANAGLQISVDGNPEPVESEIILMPSDHIILDIWTDADIGLFELATYALVAQGPGTIDASNAVIVGPIGNLLGPLPGLAGFEGVQGQGVAGTYLGGFSGNPVAGDTLVDLIDFHCDGIGEVIVELWSVVDINADPQNPDYRTDVLMDTLIIHQIPEPMTIALLGLGGLLLRRRK